MWLCWGVLPRRACCHHCVGVRRRGVGGRGPGAEPFFPPFPHRAEEGAKELYVLRTHEGISSFTHCGFVVSMIVLRMLAWCCVGGVWKGGGEAGPARPGRRARPCQQAMTSTPPVLCRSAGELGLPGCTTAMQTRFVAPRADGTSRPSPCWTCWRQVSGLRKGGGSGGSWACCTETVRDS